MKKLIFSLMLVLTVFGTLSLNSCTKSKTELVNEMVEGAKKGVAGAEAQGMKVDVKNVNDEVVMEFTLPIEFTEEVKANLEKESDKAFGTSLKSSLTADEIKAMKDNDINIRVIYKDTKDNKVEKVIKGAEL